MLDSRPLFHRQRFSTTVEKLWIFRKIGRPDPMNVWKQVLDRLEQDIDRSEYVTWFAPTRCLAQRDDTVDVSVPSQGFVDAVGERSGHRIRLVLAQIACDRRH